MWRWVLGGIAALGFVTSAAVAQAPSEEDSDGIGIELNKLEQVDDACRVYLVVRNEMPRAFESFELDLFFFDAEGIISKRLLVELGPIRPEKMLVEVFDAPELECTGIDQILIDDVRTCRSNGADLDDCIDMVQASSRASAEFLK